MFSNTFVSILKEHFEVSEIFRTNKRPSERDPLKSISVWPEVGLSSQVRVCQAQLGTKAPMQGDAGGGGGQMMILKNRESLPRLHSQSCLQYYLLIWRNFDICSLSPAGWGGGREGGEGDGGRRGEQSRGRKKKNRSVQHFTEASAGCLNINLKASINNGVRHAANWGPSEPTLVSGPSVASPCSIPDWSLDRRGRHLTGVYWLVLDTVRSFFPQKNFNTL